MAIDSALKRRNAAGVTFPASPSVLPDSDQDEAWRASVAWGYYIEASELLVAPRNALGPDTLYRHLGTDSIHRHLGAD